MFQREIGPTRESKKPFKSYWITSGDLYELRNVSKVKYPWITLRWNVFLPPIWSFLSIAHFLAFEQYSLVPCTNGWILERIFIHPILWDGDKRRYFQAIFMIKWLRIEKVFPVKSHFIYLIDDSEPHFFVWAISCNKNVGHWSEEPKNFY